jgi:hypothetical protein
MEFVVISDRKTILLLFDISIWFGVHIQPFYFVAENLVLWARSETIGYAVNPAASGTGMMEYWNVGMLKTRV